jgi:isopenicillin N synthase-like dioxygenase
MNSQVPTIDFERFVHGSIKDREQTAIEIDKSLKTLGFFYLRNHGVDQRKIDASFEWVSRSLILRCCLY